MSAGSDSGACLFARSSLASRITCKMPSRHSTDCVQILLCRFVQYAFLPFQFICWFCWLSLEYAGRQRATTALGMSGARTSAIDASCLPLPHRSMFWWLCQSLIILVGLSNLRCLCFSGSFASLEPINWKPGGRLAVNTLPRLGGPRLAWTWSDRWWPCQLSPALLQALLCCIC